MRLFFLILFTVFTGIITTVSAQGSNSKINDFDTALSLYKAGQYTSARLIFDRIKIISDSEEMQSECAYYQAMCAVREYQSNAASLLQRFVIDYPTSTRINQAYSEMGQLYFQQEKYDQVLVWYDKVDEAYLEIGRAHV